MSDRAKIGAAPRGETDLEFPLMLLLVPPRNLTPTRGRHLGWARVEAHAMGGSSARRETSSSCAACSAAALAVASPIFCRARILAALLAYSGRPVEQCTVFGSPRPGGDGSDETSRKRLEQMLYAAQLELEELRAANARLQARLEAGGGGSSSSSSA